MEKIREGSGQATSETESKRLFNRLTTIQQRMAELDRRVDRHKVNIFGSEPESVDEEGKDKHNLGGFINDTHSLCSLMEHSLEKLERNVTRIERF